MSAYATNVVRMIPRQLENIEVAKYQSLEINKDRQSLSDLSLYLRKLRRELAAEVAALDVAGAMAAEPNVKLQTKALIEQIEALEAGMNKLIGAMTTHQPR